MLQWDWPHVWTVENREAVRVAMESALRKAMSGGSQNAQIRGTVSVDLPQLGSCPPEVVLSGIRELSLEHTALMVKVRYDGDFSVTLKGLELNLDTISSSGGADEVDGNYAMPFFCPLDLTLHDIYVDGMASIEVFQEFEETSGDAVGASQFGDVDDDPSSVARDGPASFGGATTRRGQSPAGGISLSTFSRDPARRQPANPDAETGGGGAGGFASASPSRAAPSVHTSGYGVLLGAGGRRAMRPPQNVVADDRMPARRVAQDTAQEPSKNARKASADARAASATRTDPPPRRSLVDMQSHKVRVSRRTLKVQLFGDPVKSFRVQTNFASVPGANLKVEATIKMLLKPTIDRLMKDGITITLP